MAANAYLGVTPNAVKIHKLIEYSVAEAGALRESQTPQLVNAARQALYFILQDLSNKGELLFLWRYILVGGLAGVRQYSLPPGTIDIRVANFRYPANPLPTTTLPTDNPLTPNAFDRTLSTIATGTLAENWFGAYFGATGLRVVHVGINAVATVPGSTTYQLLLESSTDGSTWTLFESLPSTSLSDGEWQYFQIDGAPTIQYWRVRQLAANGILSVREVIFGSSQQDITLTRLNRDDYHNLPNKDFQSNRALQYWFDRQEPSPIVNLWPVPQDSFGQIFQFILEQQMPDVGKLGDSLAVPDRWMNYIQLALSAKISLQIPSIDPNRISLLHDLASSAYAIASGEERDKSPLFIRPNTSYYVYNR